LDYGAPKLLLDIDTIADGVCPIIAGELTYEHALELMDDVVTVSDDAIREATGMLIRQQKLVVEWSGAATTAALISEAVDAKGAQVAVVISGGNLDSAALSELA
jgi:threonine dehydratase